MEKNSFLDTNVIFNYSNHHEQSKEIVRKCYLYISNKKGKFIICGAVLEELQEIIVKRARIHKAVIKKIAESNYSFEDDCLISKKDIPFAKQLYENLKSLKLEKASFELSKERDLSKTIIEKFLSVQIDERAIPIEQIDNELVNKIYDIIQNHADCKILASALQLQKDRELFLFVTADGKDLDPNGYDFLKDQFELNYPKEKYKFPDLLNLMFVN
jgi:predicted nucleic acid-binding protein